MMMPFAPELEPLLAVAAAAVDTDGHLLWANEGFRRIIAPDASVPPRTPVADRFIQPSFPTLVSAQVGADSVVHKGLLTINGHAGQPYTLRGIAMREGPVLRVLAEHDLTELERLRSEVPELNAQIAALQRELSFAVQARRQLQRRLDQTTAEVSAPGRAESERVMLSICMYCKKVRVGHYWQDIEKYMAERTDTTISVAMCADCYEAQQMRYQVDHPGQS